MAVILDRGPGNGAVYGTWYAHIHVRNLQEQANNYTSQSPVPGRAHLQ